MDKSKADTRGYKIIRDAATCKAAAEKVKKKWGGIHARSSRPLGCYISCGSVYLSHTNNAVNEGEWFRYATRKGYGKQVASAEYDVVLKGKKESDAEVEVQK